MGIHLRALVFIASEDQVDHHERIGIPFADMTHDPVGSKEAMDTAEETGCASYLNSAGELGIWWNEFYGAGDGLIATATIRVPCCSTSLSDRELDTCVLFGQDISAVEIASILGISRSSADKYAVKAKQKWLSNCNGCNRTCVISDGKLKT